MAVCCIGGVCIPYSALIPLLIYGLKWLLEKLSHYGILPETWQKRIYDILNNTTKKGALSSKSSSSCCCDAAATNNSSQRISSGDAKGTSVIQMIDSLEQWDNLFKTNALVICKFTADWCGPCKVIQPYFEELATGYTDAPLQFCVIDVDHEDVQDIVGALGIAVLPSFCVLENKQKAKASYTGSDRTKLKELIQNAVGDLKKSQ